MRVNYTPSQLRRYAVELVTSEPRGFAAGATTTTAGITALYLVTTHTTATVAVIAGGAALDVTRRVRRSRHPACDTDATNEAEWRAWWDDVCDEADIDTPPPIVTDAGGFRAKRGPADYYGKTGNGASGRVLWHCADQSTLIVDLAGLTMTRSAFRDKRERIEQALAETCRMVIIEDDKYTGSRCLVIIRHTGSTRHEDGTTWPDNRLVIDVNDAELINNETALAARLELTSAATAAARSEHRARLLARHAEESALLGETDNTDTLTPQPTTNTTEPLSTPKSDAYRGAETDTPDGGVGEPNLRPLPAPLAPPTGPPIEAPTAPPSVVTLSPRPDDATPDTQTGTLWDTLAASDHPRSVAFLALSSGLSAGSAANALGRWKTAGHVVNAAGKWQVAPHQPTTVSVDEQTA